MNQIVPQQRRKQTKKRSKPLAEQPSHNEPATVTDIDNMGGESTIGTDSNTSTVNEFGGRAAAAGILAEGRDDDASQLDILLTEKEKTYSFNTSFDEEEQF